MMKDYQNKLPFIAALLILWVSVFIPLNSAMSLNNGHLIYTLDDTYIHMAMAKHLAEDGVFGVTKYQFTPTSSSPLWTLLLSLFFFIFGVSEFTPFILNLFLASLLILLLAYLLNKTKMSALLKTAILSAFIFFLPLPYLVMTGLEHILQIIFSLLIILVYIRIEADLSAEEDPRRYAYLLYLLAFLSVSTRYEGLFLVGAVSLLLILKKRFLNALITLVSAFMPVILFGLLSLINGWYFIPNSILLKGNKFDLMSLESLLKFLYNGLRQVIYNMHIFTLVVVLLIILVIVSQKKNRLQMLPCRLASYLFLMATAVHMFFAKSGYFLSINFQLRYDAYLLAMGMLALMLLPAEVLNRREDHPSFLPDRWIPWLLVLIVSLPMAERGFRTLMKTPMASSNTYSNQYMLGKFVDKYYREERILLNDIGGINFLSDVHCLDILGLSSKQAADYLLKGQLNRTNIEKMGRSFKAKIAIVNDRLLHSFGGIPKSWELIGKWKLKKSVISPLDTISFYALLPGEGEKLKRHLRAFSPLLPDSLYVRIKR